MSDNFQTSTTKKVKKLKTTRVQRLSVVLPKVGFQYDPDYLPFTQSYSAGNVIMAMKAAKLCTTTIVPKMVDDLLGETFRAMFRLVHTIQGNGIDKFWKQVCSRVDWSAKHKRITADIVQELAIHMMECRLAFKASGQTVKNPGFYGQTAIAPDAYLAKVAELNMHQYIPNIAEDDEDDYDEVGDDDIDEDADRAWTIMTEANLAAVAEYNGQFDKCFGSGPYQPAWDEECEMVEYSDDEDDEDDDMEDQAVLELITSTKRLRISNQGDHATMDYVNEKQKKGAEHKSQDRLDMTSARLVADMNLRGLGRKRAAEW